MDRSNKNSSRSAEVYRALMDKNFPEELCREIAYKYMNTDYTATRMLGYLYRMTNPSVEMVVDEMLAILEDRERFRKKHEMEEAQDTLQQMAEGMNTVHFLGSLSDADLRAALQECDFLVLPSVANSEAFGLVQLEAMVYGKPVINTALPTGVPHVSLDGETGLTVPPESETALAKAMQTLVSDADLRSRYGAAAKKRVETVFAEDVVMQQVYDVLADSIL